MDKDCLVLNYVEDMLDRAVVFDDEDKAWEILSSQSALGKFCCSIFYPQLELRAAHAFAKMVAFEVLQRMLGSLQVVPGGNGRIIVKLILGYGDGIKSLFGTTLRIIAFREYEMQGFSTLVDYEFDMPSSKRVFFKARFFYEFLHQFDKIFKRSHDFSDCDAKWKLTIK